MDTKFTIKEAANILKVSERTLLRAVKSGKLKTEKVGRKYLVSERSINSYTGGSENNLKESLNMFLKSKKSEMISMLQKIVSMPSVSSEIGQEVKLAMFLKKQLDNWGIRNVVYKEGASIAVRATYGFASEGFLLDSPLDTLPAGDLAKWSYPPYDGEIVNGKMYGRGTADAKGGIVTQLYTLLFFKRFIDEDKVRIELVFDGGEQDGEFLGMKQVIGRGLSVKSGLIGYGGDHEELMYGARGYHRYEFATNGKAVHTGSRYKKGVNAISKMVKFIQSLESEKLPHSNNKLFPFGTRLTFSTISGGRAVNMVPDSCVSKLDVRTIPELKKKDVDKIIHKHIDRIKQTDREFEINFRYLTGQEAYAISEDEKLIKSLDFAVKQSLGNTLKHTASGPAHVGNLLYDCGVATAVWGPKGENPHSYDEYVEISSLVKTVEVYVSTIAKYFDIDNSAVIENNSLSYDVGDWS